MINPPVKSLDNSNASYRICARCIMDVSDPDISFDSHGVCNHCARYDALAAPWIKKAEDGNANERLAALASKIAEQSKGKPYDCLIGISGGVDSSYVALKARQLGLRPLAVHFDSGWNSELAVNNIENIVRKLGIDLVTVVADWDEMRDLQLSFFKAGLANCDIPQDHAFLAVLYKISSQHKIKTVLSGHNFATESVLPKSWGYNAGDKRHVLGVHQRFGKLKLKRYPTLGFFQRYFYYPYIKRVRIVNILDFMPYNKADAKDEIQRELGWRDYGGKHYESIFTRFFQSYYLPKKFGYDKRRAHLSSLILSGQMARDDALAEIKNPPAADSLIRDDKEFVAKKLGLSVSEFDLIIGAAPHSYRDYPNSEWLFKLKDKILKAIRK